MVETPDGESSPTSRSTDANLGRSQRDTPGAPVRQHHSAGPHRDRSGHPHHDHSTVDPDQVERLRVQGELLAPLTDAAISRLRSVLGSRSPSAILDLGSGPGVGTCQLAAAFETATVTAVDSAPPMLDAVNARAARLGLDKRVLTECRDLPAGVETLGPADVCWASMALHHVGDETALMAALRDRLRPNGLLCVVEWRTPPFPVDNPAGAGGDWGDRLRHSWDIWFSEMRAGLSNFVPSRPVAEMMSAAGFEIMETGVVSQQIAPPLNEEARHFAERWLTGSIDRLDAHADPADLAAIDALLSPPDDDGQRRILAHVGLATDRSITIGRVAAGRPTDTV